MHQYLDKKIMLPLHRHNFFPDFGATTFFFLIFTKIQEIPSGIPGNFREFPKILGNSQKFSGIPLFSKKNKCRRHNFFYFSRNGNI